ncbi:MAG: hypothetical protein DMG55_07610 [Acidobacteria bacterium]|nr:MAG: hypothetical protein DMG55_07610 [Acidobacteriota bacterium]
MSSVQDLENKTLILFDVHWCAEGNPSAGKSETYACFASSRGGGLEARDSLTKKNLAMLGIWE